MKRALFGKKIQNWHRPLGRTQLRRWYRRHRHDVPRDEYEDIVPDRYYEEYWEEDEPRRPTRTEELNW